MTVNFILNGEDVELWTEGEVRLLDILREHFHLLGAKSGCLSGKCGLCSVIFNGEVSPSCLIPAFRVQNSEVITIEGFSTTMEYQDIISGFAQAGLETCGYCDNGKILACEALLERIPRPNRADILEAYRGIRCRCTESETLVRGVEQAAEIRNNRLFGRGQGRQR